MIALVGSLVITGIWLVKRVGTNEKKVKIKHNVDIVDQHGFDLVDI